MLSWLTRLFERRAERIEPPATEPPYKVAFDEKDHHAH